MTKKLPKEERKEVIDWFGRKISWWVEEKLSTIRSMGRLFEEAEAVFQAEILKHGKKAIINAPKKFAGQKVIVVVKESLEKKWEREDNIEDIAECWPGCDCEKLKGK